jgi:hypothetical protein
MVMPQSNVTLDLMEALHEGGNALPILIGLEFSIGRAARGCRSLMKARQVDEHFILQRDALAQKGVAGNLQRCPILAPRRISQTLRSWSRPRSRTHTGSRNWRCSPPAQFYVRSNFLKVALHMRGAVHLTATIS